MISSKFWNLWIEYLNSNRLDNKTFNPVIQNEKLLDKNFTRKLKSGIKLPADFMIIPSKLIKLAYIMQLVIGIKSMLK